MSGVGTLLVHTLSVLFGLGAWISVNGIWVELPLLVARLPENWNLPSYMATTIQMANVGPIAYSLMRLRWPRVRASWVIYGVVSIGVGASLLLALFWKHTSLINGTLHSTGLLSLLLVLSFVDCTSSVLYMPYMAKWKASFLISYLIGEGLSGLVPSLLSLAQGVGGHPRCQNVTRIDNATAQISWTIAKMETKPNFSVEVFFYLLFAMMVLSSLSFVILENCKCIQTERAPLSENGSDAPHNFVSNGSHEYEIVSTKIKWNQNKKMRGRVLGSLLALQTWSCFMANGLLPSIQSYSCGPYGDVPFHLAVKLSALANPMAALSTMILPRAKPGYVAFLCALSTAFGAYIFSSATQSPSPPLANHVMGALIIVFVWVSFSALVTYVRVEIANLMRESVVGAHEARRNPLFWYGVATQAGSAAGAAVAFALVNYSSLFQFYDPCSHL